MDLTVRIPDDIATRLEEAGNDLSRRALEALALEEYKSGHITKPELRRMLGYTSRNELDDFLKMHDVDESFTLEEIERQVDGLKSRGM